MFRDVLLLMLLAVAGATDLRWGKIYNWTTYSGIVVALVLAGWVSWFHPQATSEGLGIISLEQSGFGLFVCGGVMLVCYVCFAGQIGGGDVKLIAMVGAFLGVSSGLEAMLWTFILGACLALIVLVWRHGAWTVVARFFQFLWYKLRLGRSFSLSAKERRPLKPRLYLAPSAWLAVVLVRLLGGS